MIYNSLLPPNLMKLGHKRLVDPKPDILTVWRTPYPVITPFKKVCKKAGLSIFGGGTVFLQGNPNQAGYITSGYRDKILDGNNNSPHFYGFAIDSFVGSLESQIEVAKIAEPYYSRIGIYPHRGILHLDCAPEDWIKKYNKRRYWVGFISEYKYFDTLDEAITAALAV